MNRSLLRANLKFHGVEVGTVEVDTVEDPYACWREELKLSIVLKYPAAVVVNRYFNFVYDTMHQFSHCHDICTYTETAVHVYMTNNGERRGSSTMGLTGGGITFDHGRITNFQEHHTVGGALGFH